MRYRVAVWFLGVVASASMIWAEPDPATHPFGAEDMVAMRRVSDPRVSPDGKVVAFTVRDTDLEANRGRHDVYLSSVDGAWIRRLTTDPEDDLDARWSPDGRHLYFLSARSGSTQVWRLALAGGEAEPVTRLPLDVEAVEVPPAGDFLVVALRVFPGTTPDQTARRLAERAAAPGRGRVYDRLFVRHWDAWEDGRRVHLFRYSLEDGAVVDLMGAMDADCPSRPFGGVEELSVSPDGRQLVLTAKDVGREEAWSTNFDLFLVPTDASRPPRRLTDNPAWDTQPAFSPDGRQLAYLAMSRPGFEADRFDVVVREWASGLERRVVLRADVGPAGDRSAASLAWAPDGRTLYATADHLGQRAVFALDVASGESRLLVPEGTVTAVQPAGERLLIARQSLTGPTELLTVAKEGSDPRRVTRVNDALVATIRFGVPEQFHFASAGGDAVYGYVVKPADFVEGRRYPVALLIHGGPQGTMGNDFHYRWNPQAYAGAGFAAVMVDFHGSTGYGQAFTDAIRHDWGGQPYQDVMQGLDHVLAQYPFLDGHRVCALGASYGAYMVNWIAGHTDRFACLVSHDGNLDERAAYFSTEELWFPEWEHGGTPWDNPEGYSRDDPVEHVAAWAKNRTPMLVVHGARDYRIVESAGLGTFTALQRLGIPSKLLYFPDENHWVLKPANSLQWHQVVLDWLRQWLVEARE